MGTAIMLISAVELIIMGIYRNVIYQENRNKELIKLCILAIALAGTYSIISIKYVNISMVINIIFFSLGCSYIYKKEFLNTLIESIVCFIIMIAVEILAIVIVGYFSIEMKTNSIFLLSTIGWVIVLMLLKQLKAKLYIDWLYKIEHSKINMFLVLNMVLIIIIFKTLKNNNILNNTVTVEIALIILIFIALNIAIYISVINELNEKNKLQLEKNFNPILEEYIHKLRANEHEYKNHLNVIYSMIDLCDEGEMKNKVQKYLGDIKHNEYLNNLLYVDNTILKAILYSKLSTAYESGINVGCNIKSNLNHISLDDMDLVILISNLLNNAIEAAMECDLDKYIEIEISEKRKSTSTEYSICLRNSIKDHSKINISKIIQKGVSTKGKGRGYGLYNIKEIVKKVNGEILIEVNNFQMEIEVII